MQSSIDLESGSCDLHTASLNNLFQPQKAADLAAFSRFWRDLEIEDEQTETPAPIPHQSRAIELHQIRLRIVGITPLLLKANELDEVTWLTRSPQTAPSGYFYSDQHNLAFGIPTDAFKRGILSVCGVTGPRIARKTAQQAISLVDDLSVVLGDAKLSEVPRRVSTQYLAAWDEWACDLTIQFNPKLIRAGDVIDLLDAAGLAIGVGERCPRVNGYNGTFYVTNPE